MSVQESKLTREEINELYDRATEWYSRIHLHYLIAKKSYRREFAIMSPDGLMRRTLRVHNAQGFQYIMKNWRVVQKLYEFGELNKFYHSASIYENGVPYQNHDLSSNVASKIWNDTNASHMIGYDMFIDIDAGDHNEFEPAKESMQIIHEYLKGLNLPHEIKFSGCGFHVIVPAEYLPNKSFIISEHDNIYKYCLKFAKFLNKNYSEMVDTSVYDPRRLIKCPYTLALYQKDLYVCTPLVDEHDIYSCKLEHFTPEYVDIQDGFKLFWDDKKQVIQWESEKQNRMIRKD